MWKNNEYDSSSSADDEIIKKENLKAPSTQNKPSNSKKSVEKMENKIWEIGKKKKV